MTVTFQKALEMVKAGARPIRRDAFLYMEPKGDGACFAQCKLCRDHTPSSNRCVILGPDVEVTGDDSCGLFVAGAYSGQPIETLVTPEEAGFVRFYVRCENCKYGGAECDLCDLYRQLNAALPTAFDLDTKIKPHACCNGFTRATK